MKKLLFIFFIQMASCVNDPYPPAYSTTGEIVVEKLIQTQAYATPSPKVNSTTAFIVFIDGTIKEDITIEIYDSSGDRLIIKRIIPKGTYTYKLRDFRVDYYEAKDALLRVTPANGSEESFKFKWIIV